MSAKKIFLSLLLFVVLLVVPVNAQEDFKATSTPSVELCPCSNQAYSVTVENTGTTSSSYRVLADGDAKDWVTFNPDKFALNPGQNGAFSVIVNSVCNIEGDFDLEIFIATSNGLAKVIKQNLKFLQCYDYSLDQGNVVEEAEESISFSESDASYSLCKDEQKSLPILITNNENFENRYRLVLDAPEWAELNGNSVRLDAKKSGIVLINFDTTDVEGEFDFRVNAISELGEVQRKNNIDVEVGKCYALDIDLEKESDVVCGGEEVDYDVIVKNSGTLGQSTELELDGPEWANIENGSFYLRSEEERTIRLNVKPQDDVSGSFLVEVSTGIENKTGLKFSDSIEIEVIQKSVCYKADIDSKSSINNFYEEDFFFANVRNDGIKKATYSVSLEGESWVSVSPTNLELNPGQTGNINLNVNPGTDVEPGTYGIKIILESNGTFYSKDADIILKKESEFVKILKSNIKLYQYYIYLLAAIIVLLIVFRKHVKKAKNKIKKRYEKYKVKEERLRALKLARKEGEEDKKKQEQNRKEENKKEVKKKPGKEKKKTKKIKIKFNKILVYMLLIIAAIIFIGHQNRLFNAKYLHLYIINFFVGYFYYISIGVGVIVVLFLLVLLYNFASKKRKKKQVKKEEKRVERRVRKKTKRHKTPYFKILIGIIIAVLIAVAILPNIHSGIFGNVKDFFILYQYYFISGIALLVVIIFLIRFYKPLFKFLRE